MTERAAATKTGKELEKRVAQAYRLLGAWKVEHDVELGGHQIDVYVELQTQDYSFHHIAVEVKDYNKPVGIDVVHEFSDIVSTLRRLGKVDEGVIVSTRGFSRPGRNAAKEHGIRLLDIDDLESKIVEAVSKDPDKDAYLRWVLLLTGSLPREGRIARLGTYIRRIPKRWRWAIMGVATGFVLLIALVWLWQQMNAFHCATSSYQSDIAYCWQCTCNKAFDGNRSTRWSSGNWRDNEWIALDFGKPVAIDRVVLRWQTSYAEAYTIDVSNDGLNWTSIYTETNSVGGNDEIHLPLTVTRYIRMYGIRRGSPWGYSLWEFEVYQGEVSVFSPPQFPSLRRICKQGEMD